MRRPLVCLLCAALALAGLAGCGGSSRSSGLASQSANSIVAAAVKAAATAHSVHLAGSLVRNGQPLGLDLDLQAGKGARGTISLAGLSFQFIQVPGKVYIKANRAFLRHFGNAAVLRLAGHWLRSSPGASGLGNFGGLTDLRQVFASLLRSHGVLVKVGMTTFAGQSAVAIRDTTKGGVLYVASTGKPYPLGVRNPGEGQIRLDHYDEAITLTPPASSVDLSALGTA